MMMEQIGNNNKVRSASRSYSAFDEVSVDAGNGASVIGELPR
jgi:hypothetical protein